MTETLQQAPEETAQVWAEAYILQLYQRLLHREPGEAEHAEWVRALCGGTPADDVQTAFLESEEYRRRQQAAEQQAIIAASGLFDAAWYLASYPDVAAAGRDPLEHYCQHGWREARAPNAYFDDAWYRAHTLIPADAMTLLDYLQRGEGFGVPPGPNFDPDWYRATYGLTAASSPLAHFLAHRRSRRVAPCPHLWSVPRLPAASGVAADDDVFAPFLAAATPLESAAADIALLQPSGLFDENHYQLTQPDVFASGMDGLLHYCAFGWREMRNPNFYFNAGWYLATNPEVGRLRVNPLVHYLLVGEANERRPVAYFEPGWYRRTYELPDDVSPLAHYLAHRRSQQFSPNSLFDPAWYLTQCKDHVQRRRDPFAHYLVAGMQQDLQPSAEFDAAAWRRRVHGRPSRHFRSAQFPERDNPLVHYMMSNYK